MSLSTRDRYLQNARKRLRKFLRQTTCTISKRDRSIGRTGAPTGQRSVVASGVNCRLIEGDSDTDEISDQHSLIEKYTIVLPLETEIEVDYIVTVDGRDYQVMQIITRHSESSDVQAMIVRERVVR